MTVKNLIEKLEKLDDSMDVICYDVNNEYILDIENVIEVQAEKTRNEKGEASLKFSKLPSSEKHLLIEVTTDF